MATQQNQGDRVERLLHDRGKLASLCAKIGPLIAFPQRGTVFVLGPDQPDCPFDEWASFKSSSKVPDPSIHRIQMWLPSRSRAPPPVLRASAAPPVPVTRLPARPNEDNMEQQLEDARLVLREKAAKKKAEEEEAERQKKREEEQTRLALESFKERQRLMPLQPIITPKVPRPKGGKKTVKKAMIPPPRDTKGKRKAIGELSTSSTLKDSKMKGKSEGSRQEGEQGFGMEVDIMMKSLLQLVEDGMEIDSALPSCSALKRIPAIRSGPNRSRSLSRSPRQRGVGARDRSRTPERPTPLTSANELESTLWVYLQVPVPKRHLDHDVEQDVLPFKRRKIAGPDISSKDRKASQSSSAATINPTKANSSISNTNQINERRDKITDRSSNGSATILELKIDPLNQISERRDNLTDRSLTVKKTDDETTTNHFSKKKSNTSNAAEKMPDRLKSSPSSGSNVSVISDKRSKFADRSSNNKSDTSTSVEQITGRSRTANSSGPNPPSEVNERRDQSTDRPSTNRSAKSITVEPINERSKSRRSLSNTSQLSDRRDQVTDRPPANRVGTSSTAEQQKDRSKSSSSATSQISERRDTDHPSTNRTKTTQNSERRDKTTDRFSNSNKSGASTTRDRQKSGSSISNNGQNSERRDKISDRSSNNSKSGTYTTRDKASDRSSNSKSVTSTVEHITDREKSSTSVFSSTQNSERRDKISDRSSNNKFGASTTSEQTINRPKSSTSVFNPTHEKYDKGTDRLTNGKFSTAEETTDHPSSSFYTTSQTKERRQKGTDRSSNYKATTEEETDRPSSSLSATNQTKERRQKGTDRSSNNKATMDEEMTDRPSSSLSNTNQIKERREKGTDRSSNHKPTTDEHITNDRSKARMSVHNTSQGNELRDKGTDRSKSGFSNTIQNNEKRLKGTDRPSNNKTTTDEETSHLPNSSLSTKDEKREKGTDRSSNYKTDSVEHTSDRSNSSVSVSNTNKTYERRHNITDLPPKLKIANSTTAEKASERPEKLTVPSSNIKTAPGGDDMSSPELMRYYESGSSFKHQAGRLINDPLGNQQDLSKKKTALQKEIIDRQKTCSEKQKTLENLTTQNRASLPAAEEDLKAARQLLDDSNKNLAEVNRQLELWNQDYQAKCRRAAKLLAKSLSAYTKLYALLVKRGAKQLAELPEYLTQTINWAKSNKFVELFGLAQMVQGLITVQEARATDQWALAAENIFIMLEEFSDRS
ncbi:hypothetical protein G9A89_009012 [Geosiphon pyriformis]|nr:hypothetical protein G9A89_009012 [Geosiphon pyriformis]